MITTKPIDIEDAHADILQNAFKKHLSNGIHVYAFGSRANWQAKRASDLDLAIDANDALKRNIGNLEEELSLSDLPYKVDIVNLNSISDSFRKAIMPDLVPILWDWKEIKISEIVEVIGGGTPKTSVKEYWNGDIPWLSVADFNSGKKYVYNAEKHITTLALNKSSTNILAKGDIIISARGTVGVVAMLATTMTFNQSCYGIRANQKSFNGYIYYLLKDAVHHLQRISHGGVFNTITRDTFKEIKISLPPISEQKAIASVLSSIDDKIDLLHRQNNTLESIAETIFRQWFIEEANDSWEKKSLKKIANYLNGLACQKYPPKNDFDKLPVLKIKDLKNGLSKDLDWSTSDVKKEYIVQKGDIIFSWSGSLLVKIWDGETCVLNQHLFKVTSDQYHKWFIYLWTNYHLAKFIAIAESKATTMGHIKKADLDDAIIILPSDTEIKHMDKIMIPIIDKIIVNNTQIKTLESLRNILLPKLISGDIRVEYEEVS